MKYFIIIAFAVVIAGCNSTEITSSWKAENARTDKYKKIMVLSINQEKDRSLREQIERELATRLQGIGYDAHAAIDEYGPKTFEGLNEDQIVERLKSSQYDAVLTTVLLDVAKDDVYRPVV